MREHLTEKIREILEDCHFCSKQPDDTFKCEIYADYRDEMGYKTAIEILASDDPERTLIETLWDWYKESEDIDRKEIKETVVARMKKDYGTFDMTDELDEDIDEILCKLIWFEYPEDHYLKQEFNVPVMLDTGDGNTDYTLNSPYPCWCGDYDEELDDRSSLVWLAQQQGYTKAQLWAALREGDMSDPRGFLQSCCVEVANLPSHMATVTFLTKMTLNQLIELNRGIKLQDRNGRFYDSRYNPYCGFLTLGKDTETGLYDPWDGGGSVLEIQLEKDVDIPIRFIRSAMPDGADGYGVDNVYGLCGEVWRHDVVKRILVDVGN